METVKYCSPGVFSYTAFFTVYSTHLFVCVCMCVCVTIDLIDYVYKIYGVTYDSGGYADLQH